MDRNEIKRKFAQLGNSFSSEVKPRALINPKLVCHDPYVAQLLGIEPDTLNSEEFISRFSANTPISNHSGVAMVYAGHQFGGYSPRLGDGRGILVGEVNTQLGLLDIHIKGAGKTPYSRFGDGYAVLRSCIREFLAGIAMRGLGIETSHALCVIKGDNSVIREEVEPAAMLTRLAKTHIRFGSFEYFYHSDQLENLKILAQHTIDTYLPEAQDTPNPFDYLFEFCVKKTAIMIAHWQAVGFCHGVMNTDNMSILGETIDYGPYGFMQAYNPNHICNTSDHQGRYAFNRQPAIGLWNLQALAQALSPLLNDTQTSKSLSHYEWVLNEHYSVKMLAKMGLSHFIEGDEQLVQNALHLMHIHQLDYALFFSSLTEFNAQKSQGLEDATQQFLESIELKSSTPSNRETLKTWLTQYNQRSLENDMSQKEQTALLRRTNPIYTLRNYYAQQAIEQAYKDENYEQIEKLASALSMPYTRKTALDEFALLPPSEASNIAVSCSS